MPALFFMNSVAGAYTECFCNLPTHSDCKPFLGIGRLSSPALKAGLEMRQAGGNAKLKKCIAIPGLGQ